MWKQTLRHKRRLIENIHPVKALVSAFLTRAVKCSKFFKIDVTMTTEQENSLTQTLLMPPPSVRGMKTLEKEEFKKTISIPYMTSPTENLPKILKVVKKCLLKIPHLNPVQAVDGTSQKRILLDPLKYKEYLATESEKLESLGIKDEEIKMCDVNLSYDNWSAEAILKAVLPANQEGVASWSMIGHIVHINLREHLLDYKHLIGQVLLDKTKQARSIVNKANSIDSTYRTFQIELLAGEDNMLAQLKENHCTYEFDFSKVYWNSRLGGEHERLVKELQSGDVLYDVFAGVGPFAIPAAKKRCRVLANDLNPESYKWLVHNIKINKVVDRVIPFNKDGGDFICNDLREDLLKRWAASDYKPTHITMNLPAMAVEFLKHFRSLFSLDEKPSTFVSPTVHVYCFIKNADDSSKAAKELVELNLGTELGENLKRVFMVRAVSTNKDMMKVSFSLPESILFGSQSDEGEPASKRTCIREENETQN